MVDVIGDQVKAAEAVESEGVEVSSLQTVRLEALIPCAGGYRGRGQARGRFETGLGTKVKA